MMRLNQNTEMELIINQRQKEKDYWISELGGIGSTNIPYDNINGNDEIDLNKEVISFHIKNEVYQKLSTLSNNSDQLLHTILLAVLKVLIHKYQVIEEEVIVGTPIYAKNSNENFINKVLPLIDRELNENIVFRELLIKTRERLVQAIENQNFPIEYFYNEHLTDSNKRRNTLFDTALVLENIQENQSIPETCSLIFSFRHESSGLEAKIEYNKMLYNESTVERIGRYYINILTSVMDNINVLIRDISLVTQHEHTEVLKFRNKTVAYPNQQTIDSLFEEQVQKSPSSIALECKDENITYHELLMRVNQLTEVLINKGFMHEPVVAIVMDRSIDMIVAILSVLKSGGAYLPIDPNYPDERIQYMIEDSGAIATIISNSTPLKKSFNNVINIDKVKEGPLPTSHIKSKSKPQNLAYIIYTSGTTGNPKGVMVEHRNVVSLISTSTLSFDFTQNDVWTMFHSFCFDFSVWEMYGALLSGAKLVIVPKEVAVDPSRFLHLLEERKVTVLNQTPTAFYNLTEVDLKGEKKLLHLKYIIFGGETLSPKKLESWRSRYEQVKFINMYGITETTVHVTFKEILAVDIEKGLSNIGKPIPTLQVYLLDENLKIVPIGIVGELYVGGEGVARGYINRPGLTADRFIASPFKDGERLYKSGDMGRYLENGEIEYLSRKDGQVKIRGYRIETKEIEQHIQSHNEIRDVMVVNKVDQNGDSYLCAYVIAENKKVTSMLRMYLSNLVPSYMIPAFFIPIDSFPLTSNGKIDIKALPEPHEYVGATRECTPPRDHIEERLLYLLKEVLLLKGEIGIEDNFFDLGGHSLKAFTLSSKVYNEFNIKLPLSVIFEKPTVKEIAAYLRESNTTVIQTIKPVEIQDNYPLSSAQKRMFIENEINKHSVIYNIPSLLKLRGVLNKERLMKAFHELIDRHEVLRTGFYMIDDLPVQKVYEKVEFDIQDYHLKNNEIEDIFGQFVQPFDLTNPPLLRVGIITIDELTHFLMVDLHHIVADAESIQVLINEIVKLYKDISLPVLNLQYKDYATWQQKEIERNAFTKQEEYWMDFLSGELPVLQLPTDYKRGVTQTYEGCSLMFDIDIQLAKRIEDLAKMNNVTPYMVYLAGYYSLLFRYTGQEDIIIGTPTSGRTRSELDNMFGVFFNLLPLRNQLTGKNSFIDFLLKLKYNVTKSFENQDYPFENLLEKISINRKLSRHPLFDAVFALQKSLDRSIYMGDVTVELSHNSTHTSKFDLMLTVLESEDKLCFEIEYSADLFTNQTIKKIGEAYLRVLEQIVENPYQKLSAIDILSDNEKSQLLIDFNNTEVYYPKKKLLHQLFEEQVIITPDKVAIVCNEQTLTYRELNEKSNRLARVLRNHGVTNQSVVGVAVERSVEMVIGIVAILKAGAAFLPMDITLPDTRIQFMLDECRVEWMLVNSHSFVSNNFGRKIVNLKEVQQIDNCTTDNLEFVNQPEDLAYILYTSGSTGTPKGVMIEHQSVHNFFIGMQEHLEFHEQNTILAFTNISFDIFIVETLLPLTKGMKVVIADKNTLGNIGEITQDIIAHNVDVLQMTPSTMSLFIKEARDLTFLKGIKKIMIGGDKFPQNLFEELRINSTATIYNMYGPTETTIWSSIKKLTSDSKQSIGRPIANTKMYILDSHDQLVPIGFIGELCIGGDGLSRGYINRENLTNAKFIDSPFENGTKIYKTGDLARRLPNGEIEYVGRSDSQIKLRGYRIELGEIESLLNKYFTDLQSIVTVKELNDTLFICAYLVTSTNHDSNEIRDYLQTYLPVYMIPSYFIHIDKIPLSNNGKVDRNALPMPIVGENTKSIQVPTNLLEKKLMDLWADILSTDTFGIDDNFFELGGHSLRAISLVNRIHKDLGIHILLTDLFTNSTIKSLADFINRSRKSDYINIHPVEKANYYPLSSTQQRMFILNQLDKEDTSYNMLMSLQIKGNIDKKKIECSFNKLIERHEALRTRFEFKEGQPVQIVENQLSLNIESLNIKEEQLTNTLQYIRRPFDLMKSPLIRVTLIETDKSNGFLIVEIHHILCDGLSTQIILDEFIKIYHNKPLPKLSLYYKDYAVWQQEMMDTPVYTNQEKYWLNEFIDPIPILNLPADYSRPSIKSFTGGEVFTKLDLSVVTRLNHFARTEKTTIYNILFSAYSILLHKYSEQEELCIGTTLNGRNHDALELMIGVFVNTMPVRVRTERNKDYTDFLNEIGYKTLELLTNQDYQFDTLVKKLGLQGNLSRNPIFDVAFTFNTMRLNSIQINDLEVRPYRFEHMTSQFDLQLIVTESEDSIELIMEYSTDLYKKETITEMMENYLEILQQIIDNPEKKIEEFHIESRIKKNKEALLNQYSSFDF